MEHRIIIRNPNVTPSDRLQGHVYIAQALPIMDKAVKLLESNETLTEGYIAGASAMGLLEKAAGCLGFRNATDMKDYLEIYGTL